MRAFFRMTLAMSWILCLALTGFAQTQDVNSRILEEMRAMRTSMDRLVQLMEAMQRSQGANLALQQIQMYDKRLATLESQREQLLKEEMQLASEVQISTEFLRNPNSSLVATATGAVTVAGQSSEMLAGLQDRLTQLTSKLDETRGKRQAAEAETIMVKNRIADLEKLLDTLSR